MKKIFIIVCVGAMTFFILLYPQDCLESAKNGLNLWFYVVLPSLLPFMVASSILLQTGIVKLLSFFFSPVTRFLFSAPGESAFIFIASALSGYPVGAKLTAELYSNQQISEDDAHTIIRFTSVSGPLFITGAVASGMLGTPEAGTYLLCAHYLSAVLTGVIFGLFRKKRVRYFQERNLKSALTDFKKDITSGKPFGELLSESIEKSFFTLIKIGGFIIVFSVLMEVLFKIGVLDAAAWVYSPLAHVSGLTEEGTRSMIIGGIEMTNGCKAISSAALSLPEKLPIVSSIIAFGGACIHMQTKSVCSPANLIPKHFITAKSIQAIIAYIVCIVSLSLFPIGSINNASLLDIKTAAFYGLGFILITLSALVIVKLIQRKKTVSTRLTFGRKL